MLFKVFLLSYSSCLLNDRILILSRIQVTAVTLFAWSTGDLAKMLAEVTISIFSNICTTNIAHDVTARASELVAAFRFDKGDTAERTL